MWIGIYGNVPVYQSNSVCLSLLDAALSSVLDQMGAWYDGNHMWGMCAKY